MYGKARQGKARRSECADRWYRRAISIGSQRVGDEEWSGRVNVEKDVCQMQGAAYDFSKHLIINQSINSPRWKEVPRYRTVNSSRLSLVSRLFSFYEVSFAIQCG